MYTIIIVIGCAACVFASSKEKKVLNTVNEIMVMYRSRDTIIFLISFSLIILFLRLVVSNFFSKFFDWFSVRKSPKLHRFSHPASAGLVASLGVLFAKYMAEIVHSIIKDTQTKTAFSHAHNVIETVIVCILLFLTIFLQVRWLNHGLENFNAQLSTPTFQVCWVIGSVSGGAVVYHEMAKMDRSRNTLFLIGAIMAIGGVFMMSQAVDVDIENEKRKSKLLENEPEEKEHLLSEVSSQAQDP